MRTVQDARQAIMGPGGAVIRSLEDEDRKRPFVEKAKELGRQIAADNNVDFETGDVPNDTSLSEVAIALLEELETIKDGILRLQTA